MGTSNSDQSTVFNKKQRQPRSCVCREPREAQMFVETRLQGAEGPSSVKTDHCLLSWPSQ